MISTVVFAGWNLSHARSEEHTSELQSHSDLHSFPTRRSSDLTDVEATATAAIQRSFTGARVLAALRLYLTNGFNPGRRSPNPGAGPTRRELCSPNDLDCRLRWLEPVSCQIGRAHV